MLNGRAQHHHAATFASTCALFWCQTKRNSFWIFFFNIERKLWRVSAISCWTEEDQLQIWSSYSSSSNNHLHYPFYNVTMEMLTYSHSMSINSYYCLVHDGPGLATMRHNLTMSRQDNVATWFVAYQYRKPIPIIKRIISKRIYIYIYPEFFAAYIMLYIQIYRVGDNRITVVNTSRHISDQLGTENVINTVMFIYRSEMSSSLQ